MSQIYPNGSRDASIWVVSELPFTKDSEKGYFLGGSYGYAFDKIWNEAGLPPYYGVAIKDDESLSYGDDYTLIADWTTNNHLDNINLGTGPTQPPFIVALGNRATYMLCPHTGKHTKKKGKPPEASLDCWAGSLLTSPFINYPHYVIPTYGPDFTCANWWYRDIQINIDLGHVRDEYEYWLANGRLQELPARSLITAPHADALCEFLVRCLKSGRVSCDIETIYKKHLKNTKSFKTCPGLPYTNSFAISRSEAVSWCLWDYSVKETMEILLLTDDILNKCEVITQNGMNFDYFWLRAMGLRFNDANISDTLIRHHMLWPEMEHSLQFLTRQYTRQPFYKEDGKGWSVKHKEPLMRYNCLDTTITYEVWEEQNKEFADRPSLA